MNKDKLKDSIYAILITFEKQSYDAYYSYLSHQIISLSGYGNEVLNENVRLLCGLRNLGENALHNDVRHTVLHIINDIDRRVNE